jgi:hypothetical protein
VLADSQSLPLRSSRGVRVRGRGAPGVDDGEALGCCAGRDRDAAETRATGAREGDAAQQQCARRLLEAARAPFGVRATDDV